MPFSHSKLPSDTLRDGIEKVLQGAKDKPRKFIETIELQVGLKQYDPQKDKRFNGTVSLPVPRPKLKLCMLGDAKHCRRRRASASTTWTCAQEAEQEQEAHRNSEEYNLYSIGIRDQADSPSARPRPNKADHAVHAQRAPENKVNGIRP